MPATATTVQGRLLCASACAYAIVDGEDLLHPDVATPYYAGVGFMQPPVVFQAGGEEINACLVGMSDDGLVVAFRGTLPLDGPFTIPTLLDWLNNLNAEPIGGGDLPGQVHKGFLTSLDSLWTEVRDEVERQLAQAGGAMPLLVTGHSKGGAIAALAAMRFRTQATLASKVVTFAAPKAGNHAFANAYNAVMDHTRYEFADDIVPHLPPSDLLRGILNSVSFLNRHLPDLEQFDYARVGSLLYINRAQQIVPDPQEALLSQRQQRLVSLILGGHLQQIGDDHRISCGYGYMTALCPTGVCPPPLG
jgi:triacylglycerol lipase